MTIRIAFVGAGPTTLYTLHALLTQHSKPFRLAVYEAQASAGRGTPYRPGWNDPAMLANIASIEIPPLAERTRANFGSDTAVNEIPKPNPVVGRGSRGDEVGHLSLPSPPTPL